MVAGLPLLATAASSHVAELILPAALPNHVDGVQKPVNLQDLELVHVELS